MNHKKNTDIDPETKRIMERTLGALKGMDDRGTYPCYDSMQEDIALSHTGRGISDKGHWVFDELAQKADAIREEDPELAEGIDTVIQFYDEHDLVNPSKGQSMRRDSPSGHSRHR